MARLAMDPRGRALLDDAEFMGRLGQLSAHPEMLQASLGDERMQLALEIMLGVRVASGAQAAADMAAQAAAGGGGDAAGDEATSNGHGPGASSSGGGPAGKVS